MGADAAARAEPRGMIAMTRSTGPPARCPRPTRRAQTADLDGGAALHRMKPVRECARADVRSRSQGLRALHASTEDGEVIRLVPEEKRAWHAGVAYWRGHDAMSIRPASGSSWINPGHACGYRPFAEAQIDALVPLLAESCERYDIPRANVVGHSDVAPARKIDPGELFPWDRLAEYGLCLPRPTKLALGRSVRQRRRVLSSRSNGSATTSPTAHGGRRLPAALAARTDRRR